MVKASRSLADRARCSLLFAVAALLPACAAGGGGPTSSASTKRLWLEPAAVITSGKAMGIELEELFGDRSRLNRMAKDGAKIGYQSGKGWMDLGDAHHQLRLAVTEARPHALLGARIMVRHFEPDETWQAHARRFGLEPGQLHGVIDGTANSFRSVSGWLGVYATQHPNWFVCVGNGRPDGGRARGIVNELLRIDSPDGWQNRNLTVSGFLSWQQTSRDVRTAIEQQDGRQALSVLEPFRKHMQPKIAELLAVAQSCADDQEERLRVPRAAIRKRADALGVARKELRLALANGNSHRAAAWARMGQRHEPRALLWWQIGEIRARMANREPLSIVRLSSQALNSQPDEQDRIELLRLRASANAKLGHVAEAIGDTANLLRRRPDDRDAQRLLHSLTAQELQRSINELRRKQCEQRVAANPKDCSAYIALAMALLQAGDQPKALDAFARAGSLDAKQMTPALWLQYADLLGSRGEYSDGFDALQRAEVAHPESKEQFEPLADLLLAKQIASNATIADEFTAEPEAAKPSPAPRRTIASWQQLITDYVEQASAISAFADQLASTQKELEQPFEDPSNQTDWDGLAKRWQQHAIAMRKNEAAREALGADGTQHSDTLDRQRNVDAANADALHGLNSQLDDARSELYQRTHADAFEAAAKRAEAWAQSIASLPMLQKGEQAMPLLEAWLQVEPPPPLAVAAQGLQAYRERNLAQAALLLHGSLALQPDHQLAARVHEALRSMDNVAQPMLDAAAELRAAGDAQRAISVADQAVLLAPHQATGYANRARAHAALGAWRFALKDLSRAVALAPLDQELRHERSRAAQRVRRFDLCLLDADTLLAQQPGAAAHSHRSRARELVLDLQGAWLDANRAARLRGKQPASKRIYRTPWENDLAQPCLRKWRSLAARGKCTAHEIWDALPWRPDKHYKDLIANRLLELIQADAPASEWQQPLDGGELARTWTGMCNFLFAEWLSVTSRRDQARPYYRAVCSDAEAPPRLAVLAAHRLKGSFEHPGGTRNRAAILVPQDYATLDEAMRKATIGQTIRVADGRYRSSLRCNKSLNIVGHGPGQTTIVHAGKNGEVGGRLQPTLSLRNLRLEGGPTKALDAAGKGIAAQSSLAVLSGALLCDNVAFGARFCIWATAGSSVELIRCVATNTGSYPLLAVRAQAIAWLDRCLLDRSVVARDGGTAVALGVHLDRHSQVVATGKQSSARLRNCFVAHHVGAALMAIDEAELHAQDTVIRGAFGKQSATAPITASVSNGKVTLEGSVVLGRTTDLAQDAIATSLAMANGISSGEPIRVASIDELRQALSDHAPYIELAKGTYRVLGALDVNHAVVLTSAEAGVVLQGRVDRNDTVIKTGDAARLEVHGVRFEFATARPHPTIAKAFELLSKRYSLYRCIAGEGRVACIDCDFAMPTTVDARERYAVLDGNGGAMLLDQCTGKGRLLARDKAQVWLANAPVSDVTVTGGATLHTTGTHTLRRIEVQQGSHLQMFDSTANGIDFVTIGDDVKATVRSAAERLLDGIAPAQLSKQLWAAAYSQHIAPMTSGALASNDHTVWTWLHAIDGYRDALSAALRLVETNSDKRAERIATKLLPLFRGHPERTYNFNWKSYGREDRRVVELLRKQVPKPDRDWIKARATASWELGMDATSEQVDEYQPWIALRLKGVFSKSQVRDARANGYSIPQYRRHLARLEAERQRKEAVVRAALASGDRNRIRAALLAFGGDRYARFLIADSSTSDDEINLGITLANSPSVARQLHLLKQTRQAAATARAAASRHTGNSGHSTYRTNRSSSYQPRRSNDFQQWHNRQQRWNRSMDRWISNFKSSQYNSYQNRY